MRNNDVKKKEGEPYSFSRSQLDALVDDYEKSRRKSEPKKAAKKTDKKADKKSAKAPAKTATKAKAKTKPRPTTKRRDTEERASA